MDFDPTKLDWQSGFLAGWTYDQPVNKWFQGSFRNAHRLTRTCPTCSDIIVLDVTTKALLGSATNHGFALRRCKKCRAALKQGPNTYANYKAAIAIEPVPVAVAVPDDYAELRAELAEIKTENSEYVETITNQMQLIGDLKRRLAQHELPEAMIQAQNKMPWEA